MCHVETRYNNGGGVEERGQIGTLGAISFSVRPNVALKKNKVYCNNLKTLLWAYKYIRQETRSLW